MTNTTAEVLTDVSVGVLTVTINRPAAKNAATKAVADGIADAMDRLDSEDDLKVGVITGAGGTFCAGMDLKGFLRGERPTVPGRGFAGLTMAPPKKPLIAAVEGWALAGGFEIVLACDMVVAARGARFGIPETKRGLAAAGGGLLRLGERIAPNIAMEMALTGDPITAERAAQLGLVNEISEDGGALAGAHDLAHRVAANGPLATLASKQVMRQVANWPADERWERQQQLLDPVFASLDAKEGSRAFAEKRAPQWQGR